MMGRAMLMLLGTTAATTATATTPDGLWVKNLEAELVRLSGGEDAFRQLQVWSEPEAEPEAPEVWSEPEAEPEVPEVWSEPEAEPEAETPEACRQEWACQPFACDDEVEAEADVEACFGDQCTWCSESAGAGCTCAPSPDVPWTPELSDRCHAHQLRISTRQHLCGWSLNSNTREVAAAEVEAARECTQGVRQPQCEQNPLCVYKEFWNCESGTAATAEPGAQSAAVVPASCSSFSEFLAFIQVVNDSCCTTSVDCPSGGIPTSCTAACAAVLLPLQERCARMLSHFVIDNYSYVENRPNLPLPCISAGRFPRHE